MANHLRRRFFIVACSCLLFPVRHSWAQSLVDIRNVDPSISVDIRYATKENFMHEAMYPVGRCLLAADAAKRLAKVRKKLAKKGLGLKVWDCYRPLSVQRKLWEKVPNEDYVADPAKGSRHNRGAAVDLTLVDRRDGELEMPTPYDEFSPRAHRDYQGGSYASRRNRALLETAMLEEGFAGLPTEWWHFDYKKHENDPVKDWPLEPVGQIENAGQMIVVVAEDWQSLKAEIYLFERTPKGWKKRAGFTGVVGQKGLGWGAGLNPAVSDGPRKREGDLKSPAGVFTVGPAYGEEPALPFETRLPYHATENLACVDDPRSKFYNQIVDKSLKDWASAEEMKRTDDLYKRLFVVEHNFHPPVAGAGSCIFFHIWRNKNEGTVGCTALSRKHLERIMAWLDPRQKPLIIQLPADVYEQLLGIWNLPPL